MILFAAECVHNCNVLRSSWAIFTDPAHFIAETLHDSAEFIVVSIVLNRFLKDRLSKAFDRAFRRTDRELHGHDH